MMPGGGNLSVGGSGSGLPPPPYPGFSPSHSPASSSQQHQGSSPSPQQFYPLPPKPSPNTLQLPPPSNNLSHLHSEQEEKQRLRFQIELEFVQCLANPSYLNFLAQRGFFKEPSFVNYLKYLQYWKEPAYVKFVKYPVCLHFLELLQHEAFRKEIVNAQCAKFLDDQTILHWQHYSRKRVKLVENATGSNVASVSGTPASQTTQPTGGGPPAASANIASTSALHSSAK